jgi:hypothetical protein
MPLTTDEFELLKQVYQNLQDGPLKPGDPRYEAVYGHPGCEDPVDLLQRSIVFSPTESVCLFSGFRGSGKTTELYRLRKRMEDRGDTVLYADALDYVNPSAPIDISVLLIALAGAFGDALCGEGIDIGSESYSTRLWNWLTRTNVDVTEFSLKAGFDLKAVLRNTPSFRERLKQELSGRIAELHQEVTNFFEDGVKAIRKTRGEDTRIVFLFDSLEQLRGSLTDEAAVMHSVERIFSDHMKFLRMPYVHVVYTVPPWLKFKLPGTEVRLLPCLRLWDRNLQRSLFSPGIDALRSLVLKRFPDGRLERLFGPDPFRRVDRLIELSGGHFRDLLRLLSETVLRARSLPATDEAIEGAIVSVRSSYLPIALDDAPWLAEIERERASPLKSRATEDINRLSFFIDIHVVLYLRNGEDWYDIHPLIRDEVLRIAKAAESAKPA